MARGKEECAAEDDDNTAQSDPHSPKMTSDERLTHVVELTALIDEMRAYRAKLYEARAPSDVTPVECRRIYDWIHCFGRHQARLESCALRHARGAPWAPLGEEIDNAVATARRDWQAAQVVLSRPPPLLEPPAQPPPPPVPTLVSIRPTGVHYPGAWPDEPLVSDVPDADACVLCMTRRRATTCVPCGHVYSCVACVLARPPLTCAICNGRLTSVVRQWHV